MTRKMMLIAGVAGMALTSPALADRGGHGRGGDQGSAQPQQQQQGGDRAQRQQQFQRAERQQQPQMQRVERQRPQFQRVERAQPKFQRADRREFQRVERPQRAERMQRVERRGMPRVERQQRVERPQRMERVQRVERRESPRFERQQRIERAERRDVMPQRAERVLNPMRDRAFASADRGEFRNRAQSFAQGMPFRMGTHDMRAMKPMKAERFERIVSVGDRFDRMAAASPVPVFYRTRYVDTPQYYYRYNDDLGYVYRVDRGSNLVAGLFPVFGGYNVGDPWPVTYRSSYVPYGYQSLYYDTPDYYYRYDGYGVYQIDAKTQLINALVALISGNGYGVGQVLPPTYGVYNVPMAYRSSYYDSPDAYYRYGDGFIYQIDPYSRRVEERYPLYAGYDDYLVGQRWPVAYPDYNVPYGYQSVYYDTPQYQYRYANDAIYQVDPTTQLITAVAALLSGQNFSVGQALPAGYSTYNVPLSYRDRYYDTANDWYRYNNGYVYRVDPGTGLIEEAIPVYA